MVEPSATKRIAKNFSWLFLGAVISGGFNFLSIVYLARVIGASAFGLFQFAQAFLLYLIIIVDSGLSFYGTSEIAKNKDKTGMISFNIFVIRLMIALLIFSASLILLYIIPIASDIRLLFILTFLLVFYRALNSDWVFQGLEKMEYSALSKALFSVLSFLTIILIVKESGDLYKIPLIQFIVGTLLSFIFIFLLIKFFFSIKKTDLSPRTWLRTFFLAVPLGASTILLLIYDNLDTIMLGLFDQPAVVGYYNAAYRIFYVFTGVLSLWITVVYPVVSHRLAENKIKAELFLSKFLRITVLLMLPLTAFIFLIAPVIVQFVFGSQYHNSIPALQILILAIIPLIVLNTFGGLILVAGGHFNQFFWAVMAGAVVNIVLNYFLIPSFSLIGAAIATVAAYTFGGMAAFILSRQIIHLGLARHFIKPIVVSALSVMSFIATYHFLHGGVAGIHLILSSLAFIVIFAGSVFMMEGKFILDFFSEIRSVK